MTQEAYRKEIRMRFAGVGAVVITIPKPIIEKAARSKGLSIEEFIEKYRAVALYNNFDQFDMAYRFEPIKDREILSLGKRELEELRPVPPANIFDKLRAKLKGG